MEGTSEEEFNPVGTIAVMAVLALVILVLWLWMYFGVLLPGGGVS